MSHQPATTVQWALGVFSVWIFIGAVVMTSIDDQERKMFEWSKGEPFPGLTLLLWPIWLFLFFRWRP